jgi:hypothetical protein
MRLTVQIRNYYCLARFKTDWKLRQTDKWDDVSLKERLNLRINKDILSPENVTVSNEMRRLLRDSNKDKKMMEETYLWMGLPACSVLRGTRKVLENLSVSQSNAAEI